MKQKNNIFRSGVIFVAACVWTHIFCSPAGALEAGSYRLLSVSESERLVLVSRIPDQKRFLLDATNVKVAVNDEPAEFKALTLFTVAQVQMELRRVKRKGINLDGLAIEIAISNPAGPAGK